MHANSHCSQDLPENHHPGIETDVKFQNYIWLGFQLDCISVPRGTHTRIEIDVCEMVEKSQADGIVSGHVQREILDPTTVSK